MKKLQLGIYVHWPFCTQKCPYCDFSSIVRNNVDEALWLEALLKNLERYKYLSHSHEVCSVFFGGGTPSLMHPSTLETILQRIEKYFSITHDAEITIEANPATFSRQKLQDFRISGVNRLSIGIQSFQASSLEFLGRNHTDIQAHQSIENGQLVFDNVSIDLIFGYHKQTPEMWHDDLHKAIQHHVHHLSCYQLTFEPNTPFYQRLKNKQMQHISDEEELLFAQITSQTLRSTSLQKYEISNWSCEDKQCRHNMLYWRYEDYLGIGPSAHSRITYQTDHDSTAFCKLAIEQIRAPDTWLKSIITDDNHHFTYNNHNAMQQIYFSEKRHVLSEEETTYEKILMGLRLQEGVHLTINNLKYINVEKIKQMSDILSYENNILKTRAQGEFLTNYILSEIFC